MKAFLILEDGHVFEGKSIGSTDEIISEIVFNTSMTGYLEILTDPSYAGQSVCMTYPLIGNYGVCREDMEAGRPWQSGFIVRELCKTPSNFRSEMTINEFLVENNITGIEGIDTRTLTKILRKDGTMRGMITTDENYDFDECMKRIKAWKMGHVVLDVTCKEKIFYPGDGFKVAVIDLGVKRTSSSPSLQEVVRLLYILQRHLLRRSSQTLRTESCLQMVLEIQRSVRSQ